jgi:hypothetical protein
VRWAYKNESLLFAEISELGILRKESIARMYRIAAKFFCSIDDFVSPKVTL